MTKYTIKYFIKKFSRIPHSRWTTRQINGPGGTKCVMGHCGARTVTLEQEKWPEEAKRLVAILRPIDQPYRINDDCIAYARFGRTPRTRILNALKSLLPKKKKKAA